MERLPSLQKTLHDIYSTQALDELHHFREPESWSSLKPEEKELLAILFIMKGEQLLSSGHEGSQEAFDIAFNIAPNNPKVLCRQALAFLSAPPQQVHLEAACKTAEQAVLLHPRFFDAWYVWANALMTLGIQTQDSAFYYEADAKFKEAEQYQQEGKSDTDRMFFWRWGLCWHFIAKQSGEPTDYGTAVKKYQKAAQQGVRGAVFWNDYGNALVDLAALIGRFELIEEAIELYSKAVKESPNFFEGWFNVACSYQKLCEYKGYDQAFQPANLSFERASILNPKDATLWFQWGLLWSKAGKVKNKEDFFLKSIEKYQQANILCPQHPQILREWAEVQVILGAEHGRLDYFYEAEEKVIKSLELQPDHPHGWFVHGFCLNEIGRYFADDNYHALAIEKFQQGIALHRKDPQLWYGLALAHFAVGELRGDMPMLEKAARYCQHVADLNEGKDPQFWNDWGVILMKMGEISQDRQYLEAAIDKFERTIKTHREKQELTTIDPRWLYHYGCALDFIGDFTDDERYYERAIHVLSQVLILDPDFAHARYNLALALSHLAEMHDDVESFYKASEQFQAIVAQDPEDDMAWNDWGVALLHLSQLLNEPSQPDLVPKLYQQAEAKLLQAASLGNVQSFYNLACLYSLTGNYPVAMHYIERSDLADALPPIDELIHDEWLEGLRMTPSFRHFLHYINRHNPEKQPEL